MTAVSLVLPGIVSAPLAQAVSPPEIGPAKLGPAKIAFVRHGDIYTIGVDGSGLNPLTSSGHDLGPSWSPDGTTIAFVRETSSGQYDLWTMAADGTSAIPITTSGRIAPYEPAWSPDGTTVAIGGPCVASETTPTNCDEYEGWYVLDTLDPRAPEDGPTTLTRYGDWEQPMDVIGRASWSPTAPLIAFATGDEQPFDSAIDVYDLTTRYLDVVAYCGAHGCFGDVRNAVFSPDGQSLGWDAYEMQWAEWEYRGIHVSSYPGHGESTFREVRGDRQLAFAPDQSAAVFTHKHKHTHKRLLISDIDGRHREFLTRGSQPSWQATAGR